MCLLYYTLQAPALEVSSNLEELYTFVSWSRYKMTKVSLLLLQCNLKEFYTFVSWSKYRMAKVSLFLHIITIYYLELMIFTNVIVQLMTIVIKVRRQPCVTVTDGRLYYNF